MAEKVTRQQFEKVMKARTKGGWKEARKVEARKSFGIVGVPEGDYVAQLTRCVPGIDKNGNPYFQFQYVLRSDDPKVDKQSDSKLHSLAEPKTKGGTNSDGSKWNAKTLKEKQEALAEEFQRLGKETSAVDEGELYDLAEELSKEKPFFRVKLTYKKVKGKADKAAPMNAWFQNGVITDMSLVPGFDDQDQDEPEPEDDEETTDDTDDTEEVETETEDTDTEVEGDDGDDTPPDEYEEEAPADDEGEDEEPEPEPEPAPKKKQTKPAGKTFKIKQAVTYLQKKYTVKAIAENGLLTLTNGTNTIRAVDPKKVS